jgi:hypothetical protein
VILDRQVLYWTPSIATKSVRRILKIWKREAESTTSMKLPQLQPLWTWSPSEGNADITSHFLNASCCPLSEPVGNDDLESK